MTAVRTTLPAENGSSAGDSRTHARTVRGALFLSLAACSALVGCGHEAPPGVFARPPAPVNVFQAVAKEVPVYLDEIGRCAASEDVTITPQVSGRITAIEFTDGAALKVGAPLFTIDPRPYQASLAQAKARAASADAGVAQAKAAKASAEARVATVESRIQQARAMLAAGEATGEVSKADRSASEADAARATSDLARFEGVGQSGGVSQQEIDRVRAESRSATAKLMAARQREAAALAQVVEAKAAIATAEAGVLEAKSQVVEAEAKITSAEADVQQAVAAVQTATLDVEYCSILSPIAGRAGRRLLDLGTVVERNSSPLVVIRRLDPAYVEFTVTENDLLSVQSNMARGTLRVEVRIPEAPDTPGVGDLTFLDSVIKEATGTVMLRATIPNADGRFWPGRFVKVRLVLDTIPGAVLIPAGAPMTSADGSIVFVVTKDKKAEVRPVVLGQRQGDMVAVTQGLAAGDLVVVVGQIGVTPGGDVRVDEPASAKAPPVAPPSMGETGAAMGSGS